MNISRVSASAKVCMTATAGALLCTMLLGVVFPPPAAADDGRLRFKGLPLNESDIRLLVSLILL